MQKADNCPRHGISAEIRYFGNFTPLIYGIRSLTKKQPCFLNQSKPVSYKFKVVRYFKKSVKE